MADGQSSYWTDLNGNGEIDEGEITYYDLTTKTGDRAEINGALFFASAPLSSSGTGLINAFVRVQDGGGQDPDPGSEDGYNTDFRPLAYEENSSPSFTKSLLLSDVPEVTIDGEVYYEFRLDINQLNSSSLLSLDKLILFKSATSAGQANGEIDADGGWFEQFATEVYNMDGNGDSSILLDYALQAGSGKSDMFFYVKKDAFEGANESTTQVTLYSEFGTAGELNADDDLVAINDTAFINNVPSNDADDGPADGSLIYGTYTTNDGFEEWSVSKAIQGVDFTGYKWHDTDGDATWDLGEEALSGWQINYTVTWTITYKGNQTANPPTSDSLTASVVTDGSGKYTLTVPTFSGNDIASVSYTLTVAETLQDPTTWTNTYGGYLGEDSIAINPTVLAFTDADFDGKGTDIDRNGSFETTEALNFGNTKYGKISGTKTEDLDGEVGGEQAPWTGDPVTINLYRNGDPVPYRTTQTDANGDYLFEDLPPGDYVVEEVTPTGSVAVGGATIDYDGQTSGFSVTDADFSNFIPDPSIDIEKSVRTNLFDYLPEEPSETSDDNPDGLQAGTSTTVTFKLVVKNTGNVTLETVKLTDSVIHKVAGVFLPAQTIVYTPDGDAATLDAQNVYVDLNNSGELDPGEEWFHFDINGDGIIDQGSIAELAPGETFTVYYDLTSAVGQHENTATVTAEDIFLGIEATDSDDANYYVVPEGPGVRTPGFWQNPLNGGTFWDGIAGNQAHQGPTFPDGNPDVDGNQDLLYRVDTNGDGLDDEAALLPDGSLDTSNTSKFGILVGDYNKNGITDVDDLSTPDVNEAEDTIFISYADAIKLINASNKQGNDVTYTLGRDVVATWLNYLAGNNIDAADPENSARHYLDDAIDWLQEFSSNETGPGKDGADATFAVFSHKSYKTKDSAWKDGVQDDDDPHTGSELHNALGGYNENGVIGGEEVAGDADSAAFIFATTQIYNYVPPEDQSHMMFSSTLVAV